MRTMPYPFRCCQHCSHDGAQAGHTRGCRHYPCPGSTPRFGYVIWRLFHLRTRW